LLPKNYYYFLCDTRKNMPFGLLPIFWEHRQIKLNFRNWSFPNLLTISCTRNNVLANHFQIFNHKGL